MTNHASTQSMPAGVASCHRAPSIELKPVESLVARTDLVTLGRFVCPAAHPLFRDSGPCSYHTIVFPRTATHVRRDDDSSFVADPTTVLFYNQNQCYTRSRISDVDECDWIVVADDLLYDVLQRVGSGVDRGDRPFTTPFVSTDPALYLEQRRLFDRAAGSDAVDNLYIEETVVRIVETVLRRTSHAMRPATKRFRAAVERVDAAKRAIAANVSSTLSLSELASIAECSTFELCRSFREVTGMRITEYRNALRTRLALAKIRDDGSDLTRLALELGFSSHSHFSDHFRRAFAMAPSTWRARA